MKILITGAHFTPAVAVIEEFKKTPDIEILYVGRKMTLEGDSSISPESQILPGIGVKFIPIVTGRIQRSLSIYTIFSLLKIPIGLIQSIYITLKEKPDVLLSFGGYVAVPLVFTSWLLSIPIIVHEQTLVSGLANKISSLFADKIAYSFPIKKFTKKEILTGNPIRDEIINFQEEDLPAKFKKVIHLAKSKKLPLLLITGGNQGSHAINTVVEESLDKLLEFCSVIHQTGDSKYKDYERLIKRANEKYLPVKFIRTGMGQLIDLSTLVISRAGANTLIELAYFGKSAIVIPIPYLYQDEQNKNAKFFKELGLVKILPQKNLDQESLIVNIKDSLKNLDRNKNIKNTSQVVIKDAAKRLAIETLSLVYR